MNRDRIEALRDELVSVTPELCSERAKLITESYKATKDQPTIIRKASI